METQTPTALPSRVEDEVLRLRDLAARGRDAEAREGARALVERAPENRDAWLIAAAAERRLGRLPEAEALLTRLEALQPRFSLMHQEWGMCHVGARDAPRAIDRLLRAVNLNPALPASWRMLARLYALVGEAENAATAERHVATLQALPPEVVRATSLFSDGELGLAEEIVRAFLLRHGDHLEAMRLLARIGLQLDVLDDAEALLEAVVARAPDYQAARYDYAEVLIRRQRHLAAQAQIARLLELDPARLEYRTLAATAALGLGQQAEALEIYDAMLVDAPASWDVRLWRGHVLKTVGRVPEAVDSYRAAAAARADFGDAYWSLANLKTYRFDDAEVAAMRAQEASPGIGADDRAHLCFALGKALEDRGEAGEAWRFYETGNALKRAQSRYRPELVETNTRLQKAVCTAAFFRDRQGWGDLAPDPIFIVGLPRSGSTLLEQILASHPDVEGTQELPTVQELVQELQGRDANLDDPRYPAVLRGLDRGAAQALGARYLAETRVHRKTARPLFIDKMPNNFRHIGLIQLMLPNARIIDARREPMACCFSNLKQLFAQGQEFTYSIEDIARYYRTYLDLMEHWDAALPGRVLRVRHEAVIDDLEGEVRRLLAFCGLPFHQGCIDFHANRRSVRTPSSEQVRRPIFRDGLDQWRAFAPWLGELEARLGDALTRYKA